jgi:DNA-binding MarR family transcriptional regulator
MQPDSPPQSEPAPATWPRPVLPRPHSRRNEPRQYIRERLSREGIRARRKHETPPFVQSLTDAGKTGSALRSLLKAKGVDPKMARLVLVYEGQARPRVADVAWALNISPSTASRWLDRAEREGLIDKLYDDFDRRGTWTRLTKRGTALRARVQVMVGRIPTNDRPAGVVYGIRRTRGWDD